MARRKPSERARREQMLEAIRRCAQSGDLGEAKAVLVHFAEISRAGQKQLLNELGRAHESFTVPLLHGVMVEHPELAEADSPLYAAFASRLAAWPDYAIGLLHDAAPADKSVLLRAVGDIKLEAALPALERFLEQTSDAAQARLAVRAIAGLGCAQAVETLTRLLDATDHQLALAAIEGLGQLGTAESVRVLVDRMGKDVELDLAILAALAEVRDESYLEKLNEAVRAGRAPLRVAAKEQLAKAGEPALPVLFANLKTPDADLQIHTLNILGEIGCPTALVPIRRLLWQEPESANVRFAAYEAISMLPMSRAAYALAAGLNDPSEHVRIAAARAIERNLTEALVQGIANMIRADAGVARDLVKAIIDAHVENLFLALIDEGLFRTLALDHLRGAPADVRRHYVELLRERELGHLVAGIAADDPHAPVSKRRKVCAVDDSPVMLGIYKTTLHRLGFEPVLFRLPTKALEWLRQETPALVVTDLNMPKITGIQLAEEIRRSHSKEAVPIIVVTTQHDVRDRDALEAAGINEVLSKPFDAETLRLAIARHVLQT
ncbi:MAG: response regulator [Planctomycetes bacterium]|nr:response regulator [Planctomycetota bacterium]